QLRGISKEEAASYREEILGMSTAEEVVEFVKEKFNDSIFYLLIDLHSSLISGLSTYGPVY
ncbi:hypothetical protein, partial [Bacillus sp. m3-13]|uniref:hypothetical protein n=1 Tax=Bacillus sp. m3-13 TaxID=406124 RepID=UPI0001E89751